MHWVWGDGGAFADTIVAPPFVFIPLVKSLLRSDFQIGAQNCWVKGGGAFTGEIRFKIMRAHTQRLSLFLCFFPSRFFFENSFSRLVLVIQLDTTSC
jgi:hypothetical protein